MAAYGSTSPSDTMLQDKDASHASAQCSHSSAHRQGGDLWRQCAINMRMSVLKVPIVFLIILKLENAGKCWKMLENPYSFLKHSNPFFLAPDVLPQPHH